MEERAMMQFLIALDQLINTLIGGMADETLSARAHRMRSKGQRSWGWTAAVIDAIFFWEDGHCRRAWVSELERRQLPGAYIAAKGDASER